MTTASPDGNEAQKVVDTRGDGSERELLWREARELVLALTACAVLAAVVLAALFAGDPYFGWSLPAILMGLVLSASTLVRSISFSRRVRRLLNNESALSKSEASQ